ncbi:MAG: DUF2961 domain-containing protein [Planctomycetes bacterium]|nr:DUF2961 domain-containing protein [Planctomycetota bacterium]
MKRIVLVACLAGCAGAPRSSFPLAGGLADLWRPRRGRAARESSVNPDPRSNKDRRVIAPGERLEIARLDGPGIIRHLWFTADPADPHYARNLVLRAWWDGEAEPSIEVPYGDFFGVGNAMDREIASLPVRISAEGRARNCWWPMPFARSARIEIENQGPAEVRLFYYYVDWLALDEPLPADARYFHAQYRQAYPAREGEDYLALEASGGGHYVGTVLSIYAAEPGWIGEGDDRIYIDGETTPSLQGTGTEDYFCDAWGFRIHSGPFSGVSAWEEREEGARTTAYRWHVVDPIPFRRSLRVTFEHSGWAVRDGKWVGGVYRADAFSSVAMWYQTEPHAPFPMLPAPDDRLPFEERVIEAEDLIDGIRVADGVPRPVREGNRRWSQKAELLLPADRPDGVEIELPFSLEEDGRWTVELRLTRSPDAGAFEIALDGEPIGGVRELWAPRILVDEIGLGIRDLAAGGHTIRFRARDPNPQSSGSSLGVDRIVLRRMRPRPAE